MIENYRKMMTVDRLAGKHKLRPYSVALHSYFTSILFMHFADIEGISYDVEILNKILKHDLLEIITNDLPWNCKVLTSKTQECWDIIEEEVVNKIPELRPYSDENIKKSMNEEQYKLFKAVDYLELFLFIHEEKELGNSTKDFAIVYLKCIELIRGKFKSIDDFIHEIMY